MALFLSLLGWSGLAIYGCLLCRRHVRERNPSASGVSYLANGYIIPMDHTPTNAEVADVFEQIANILEGQGENPFKIRAYRNAVRTLENLHAPAADINVRGELKTIPGFGAAIVGKTQEILATGTCALYERLKADEAAKNGPPAAVPESVTAAPAEDDGSEIVSPW